MILRIDKESKKGKGKQESDEEELSGVAGLKAQKRKKEIDDLWELMNQEDSYYKKP